MPLESQNTRVRELLGEIYSLVQKCMTKNGVGVDWSKNASEIIRAKLPLWDFHKGFKIAIENDTMDFPIFIFQKITA